MRTPGSPHPYCARRARERGTCARAITDMHWFRGSIIDPSSILSAEDHAGPHAAHVIAMRPLPTPGKRIYRPSPIPEIETAAARVKNRIGATRARQVSRRGSTPCISRIFPLSLNSPSGTGANGLPEPRLGVTISWAASCALAPRSANTPIVTSLDGPPGSSRPQDTGACPHYRRTGTTRG
jgi:hypothetical protein